MKHSLYFQRLLASVLFISFLFSGAAPVAVRAESKAPEGFVDGCLVSVPGDFDTLQDAIFMAGDGCVIELAAGVYTPPSVEGFRITNVTRSFTIRGAPGALVVLSGGGNKNVMRIQNTSSLYGHPVILQDLTIADGYSNTPAIAGGVTLHMAQVSFVNVTFENNRASANGSGGALAIYMQSVAFIFNSTFTDNSAHYFGGALEVGDYSKVYVHNSLFSGNRVNLPNHDRTSSGGAIHLFNSTLRVSNSRFEGNQAGYSGGAIYAIGSWNGMLEPHADLIIVNSTFENNKAVRDPSVSFPFPTEGGAVHIEAQASARFYNDRFINNSAMGGGAVNTYLGQLELEDCVFLGNWAWSEGTYGGYGGSIGASSNDTSIDGSINRRSASVRVSKSYFQGRYGSTGVVGVGGGAIYITGDANRTYGLGGVTKMGTLAENRTHLIVDQVIFNDLDVYKPAGGQGGAIIADLGDVDVRNSLFTNLDASGVDSFGGAIAAFNQTEIKINASTFSANSAGRFGGAVFVQGASLELTNNRFYTNEISPGVNEAFYQSFGAALFTASGRFYDTDFPMNGMVSGNIFTLNRGTAIFDDDRSAGPVNAMIYNNNQFYETDFGGKVYQDSLTQNQTPAMLNSLVITRAAGQPTTDKSVTNDNVALDVVPIEARLLIAPSQILLAGAVGDSVGSLPVYGAYSWYGSSGYLDGMLLESQHGVVNIDDDDLHTLTVDGVSQSQQVTFAPLPTANIDLSGMTLLWELDSGSFLDAAMNRGLTIASAPSGSVTLPALDRSYYLYIMTREGGILKAMGTNMASLLAPASYAVVAGINRITNTGSLIISNEGSGVMAWRATSSHPELVQIQNPEGSTETVSSIELLIDVSTLELGEHSGITIQIDAGDAGMITAEVTIYTVNGQAFIPMISK